VIFKNIFDYYSHSIVYFNRVCVRRDQSRPGARGEESRRATQEDSIPHVHPE